MKETVSDLGSDIGQAGIATLIADVGVAAYSNRDWAGAANLALASAGSGTFAVDARLSSVVG